MTCQSPTTTTAAEAWSSPHHVASVFPGCNCECVQYESLVVRLHRSSSCWSRIMTEIHVFYATIAARNQDANTGECEYVRE